jgi:hypothetical protein
MFRCAAGNVQNECGSLVSGDGLLGFVRPAPPFSNHVVEWYWRMRRAYWWMSGAEILRRLRDPEIDQGRLRSVGGANGPFMTLCMDPRNANATRP